MKWWCFILLCCCATTMFGCNRGPAKFTITGNVELDGQPVTEGEITFLPTTAGPRPEGARIRDGSYSISVEAGNFKVKIAATKKVPLEPGEPSMAGEKDKLVSIIPAEYNEETALTIEVSRSMQRDFKLTSKKN